VPDVFDALVGQDRAAEAMRQLVRHPVHAYLFTGPAGADLHDAAVAFAAALECPEHGCGRCEECRRVLAGVHPDVHVAERAGVSWRIDELREIERISRRRPLGEGYQVVIVQDVELTTTGSSPSAPAMLKTLEEPASRTVFLLGAGQTPPALSTVVSRCVSVRLRRLGDEDVERVLIGEGASPASARAVAPAANGDLRRARVLLGDPGVASRVAQWRSVPERLTGTPASATQVAADLARSLDEAVAPLVRQQEQELARQVSEARDMGWRTLSNRKDVEAHFKREQRRFRTDELRFGLGALASVYRARLAEGLEGARHGETRGERRAAEALRAIDAVSEATRRLATNLDEGLLLNDLMLSLAGL
jgi:DNA polymerase III subunit delta'